MLRRERHHENLVIDHVETENAEGIFYFLASARTVSKEINLYGNDSIPFGIQQTVVGIRSELNTFHSRLACMTWLQGLVSLRIGLVI